MWLNLPAVRRHYQQHLSAALASLAPADRNHGGGESEEENHESIFEWRRWWAASDGSIRRRQGEE